MTEECVDAIVLCADRNYFVPAYVVCAQLARNRRSQGYDICLLTEPGEHLARLPRDVPFKVLTPTFADQLPEIPELYRGLPKFGYLRLFLANILPSYRRLLYLDCDIRIDGDAASLFCLDMADRALAAVDGTGTYVPSAITANAVDPNQARIGKLGFDPTAPYFNSGVLLIDGERWRQNRLTERAIAIMRQFGGALGSYDQDVLNILFHKEWLALSPRWNFHSSLFESEAEEILNPVLLHFGEKPWNFGESIRRERKLFKDALMGTPYPDFLKGRATAHDVKHIAAKRAKVALQYATFFIPSSFQRIQNRSRSARVRALANHVMENVKSGRFADVHQGISKIDMQALASLT